MRLYARPLLNYANVNNFSYGNQWIVRSGDPNTLYFQLVDLDQGSSGLRYLPGIGSQNQPANVSVTFPSIDDAQVITAQATQDPNDGSIWSVTLSPTQNINSGNVIFAIFEGSSIRRFSVLNLVSVEYPQNDGQC